MHSSLHLSALRQFPPSIRTIALSAARGSLEDVREVEYFMGQVPDVACEKLLVFLPIFYANLDTARLPSEEEVDIPPTFIEGAVSCAEISLECIYSMAMRFGFGVPVEAFPDLWPRCGHGFEAEEVIEGAGGGLSDLADLVVGHIDQITSDGDTPQLKNESRLQGTLFDFVNDVDRLMAPRVRDDTLGPLSAALLSRNIVASLTAMLNVLLRTKTRFQEVFPLLRRSMMQLNRILLAASGRDAMMDALRAGLLRVIVLSGNRGKFTQTLKSLVEEVLPSTLVNYYELAVAVDEIRQANALAGSTFRSSAIWGPWKEFVDLATDRHTIAYNTRSEPSLKACDNAKCCKIGATDLFKRCSGCLSFYYCSLECQRLEWREKETIAATAGFSLLIVLIQALRVRERAFLRAAMTHDYNLAKNKEIYLEQVLLSSKTGTPLKFFTLFDYTRGRVQTNGWWDDVLRTACSAGRMELHVLALPGHNRNAPRFFVVPMRTETSRVQDAVADIGRSLGPGVTTESVRDDAALKELF
ncbi:hypothetical protein B0H19DRAFT_1265101 [Mycena capillaripes]|nr:hypothetical protein B0H19DRAFT_1265101 [Mycena capillaripes]